MVEALSVNKEAIVPIELLYVLLLVLLLLMIINQGIQINRLLSKPKNIKKENNDEEN